MLHIRRFGRFASFLVVSFLVVSLVGVPVSAQVSDIAYDLDFQVITGSDDGFRGEIVVSNRGDEPFVDWSVSFGYDYVIAVDSDVIMKAADDAFDGFGGIDYELTKDVPVAPGGEVTIGFSVPDVGGFGW